MEMYGANDDEVAAALEENALRTPLAETIRERLKREANVDHTANMNCFIHNCNLIPLGILATIPPKISKEIPFPIPLSLINSPSHIRNAVPAVSTKITTIIENALLSTTAFLKRPTVRPIAWTKASTTVI